MLCCVARVGAFLGSYGRRLSRLLLNCVYVRFLGFPHVGLKGAILLALLEFELVRRFSKPVDGKRTENPSNC